MNLMLATLMRVAQRSGIFRHSYAVSRLTAPHLLYYYLFHCISLFCLFVIYQGLYLLFAMLYQDGKRLVSLSQLRIILLDSLLLCTLTITICTIVFTCLLFIHFCIIKFFPNTSCTAGHGG